MTPWPKVSLGALLLLGVASVVPVAAITPADLATRLGRNEPLLLIDVRSNIAYTAGHVPGAMNIPLGLLPHKPIPSSPLVVVYGDGLGVIDDSQALAALRAKPGIRADVLEGGYAAWLSQTRLATVPPGIAPERLPGITYDQLVAAGKGDMVLVDLRPSAAPATAAAPAAPRRERQTTADTAPDILAAFAAKIGVPVVTTEAAAPTGKSQAAASPARAAAPAASGPAPGKLLVLVADNDAAANEAARQLRASGQYRFTILIGGTESIRHEGRVGTGRMDGGTPTSSR